MSKGKASLTLFQYRIVYRKKQLQGDLTSEEVFPLLALRRQFRVCGVAAYTESSKITSRVGPGVFLEQYQATAVAINREMSAHTCKRRIFCIVLI